MSSPQLPSNFARAFDLSSLTRPKQSASKKASNFRQATVENFMSDFVQASKEKPVILVAYSDRALITIELRDIFAKIAQEDNESWIFAGIDIETQPELIQALRIQSLPAAVAFIDEQLLPLPDLPVREDQIRALISQVFKIAQERGMKVEIPELAEPKLEPEEAAAYSALENGDYSGAAMAFRNWLQRVPNEPMAKIGLAQCELRMRIAALDPERTVQEANSKPNSLADQMMAADVEVAMGRHKEGFERLLNFFRSTNGYERDKAKQHLLLLFQLVDPSDPDLIRARQNLANLLF